VQIGLNMGTGVANTATWRNVTGGNAVLPNRPILDVVFDEAVLPITPTLVLTGYAAVGGFDQNTPSTPGHVFQVVCTLNCTSFTWANKTGNLPNIPVDSIMVNPRYPGQVFAGTDWGVYVTNNINVANPQWIRFNAGMPNVMIWDMAIDRGFTTLAAFTRSRGAFVWPLPSAPLAGTPEPTATGTQVINTPVVPNTHTPAPPVPTNTPTRTFTPGPTSTPLGCGGTVRFQETFESGTLGQFITDTVSGDLPWRPDNTTRHTGIWSAYIRNNER
jgi:hypothetical protein